MIAFVMIEAALFFVPAVVTYLVMRFVFWVCRSRGGYGLVLDAAILIVVFALGVSLEISEIRPKGCRDFAEVSEEGVLAVVAFLPSVPWVRRMLGKASPYAGLAMAVAAVVLYYWFNPPDYSNPINCP